MPPSPMTMPARSAVVGRRRQQDRLDLAPAAQVLGQVVTVVAQAAEVDDLAQPGVARRGGEGVAPRRGPCSAKSASASECTR